MYVLSIVVLCVYPYISLAIYIDRYTVVTVIIRCFHLGFFLLVGLFLPSFGRHYLLVIRAYFFYFFMILYFFFLSFTVFFFFLVFFLVIGRKFVPYRLLGIHLHILCHT